MLSSEQIESASQLLTAEYLDTPTLLLTPREAAELLELDRVAALSVLQALEDSGFLVMTPDGQFGRSLDRLRTASSGSSPANRRAV